MKLKPPMLAYGFYFGDLSTALEATVNPPWPVIVITASSLGREMSEA